MPLVAGETVGPNVLIEQLGQGGMAAVFKAYRPAMDRHVTPKVLHPSFSQESNFLDCFRCGAQFMARLERPNLAPMYDFAVHKGRPYPEMKDIDGVSRAGRSAVLSCLGIVCW